MIESFLLKKYPGDSNLAFRKGIAELCDLYINSGLADNNFVTELCSGSESIYWSRLSEVLFATSLLNMGCNLLRHEKGPDILLFNNNKNTWIEVICPTAVDIPGKWLAPDWSIVSSMSFPHKEILLRWTHAIKEKTEKLIGSINGSNNMEGYIGKKLFLQMNHMLLQ